MMPPAVPDTFCIGQPRLTAGLDRLRRIDRAGYQTVFGKVPRLTAEQLISMAEQVDLRGRGGRRFRWRASSRPCWTRPGPVSGRP